MKTLLGNRVIVRPVDQPAGEIVGQIHVPAKFKEKGVTEMVVVQVGTGPKVPAEVVAGAHVWLDERMGNVKMKDGNIIASTEDVLAIRMTE